MRARDNPYRSERLHSLAPRLGGGSGEGLLQRLQELGGRGCVVGPHGSGKTTILLELAAGLRKRGLRVDERVFRTDDPPATRNAFLPEKQAGSVLILDGADLLPPGRWRRIKEAWDGWLIVSSHGRRLLPVLYRCRSSPELLEELMRELHPGRGCSQPRPDQLYRRHRGNLREALLELYDFHSRIPNGLNCL